MSELVVITVKYLTEVGTQVCMRPSPRCSGFAALRYWGPMTGLNPCLLCPPCFWDMVSGYMSHVVSYCGEYKSAAEKPLKVDIRIDRTEASKAPRMTLRAAEAILSRATRICCRDEWVIATEWRVPMPSVIPRGEIKIASGYGDRIAIYPAGWGGLSYEFLGKHARRLMTCGLHKDSNKYKRRHA